MRLAALHVPAHRLIASPGMRETTISGPGPGLVAVDHAGHGPDLLLVHGLSSNLRIWDAMIPMLTTNFRVVSYDQRGHGHSGDPENGDYSFDSLVADAKAVARAFEMDNPAIVGHSWGASVAMAYAAQTPDCPGIVCVDGGVVDLQDIGMTWELTEQILKPPRLEGPPDKLLERIRTRHSVLPWELMEAVTRRSFVTGEDGIMRRRTPVDEHMAIVRTLWEGRVAPTLARTRCRILFVLAEGYVSDERAAAAIAAKREGVRRLAGDPNVEVAWLESVHDIPLLHPRELSDLVIGFLGRNQPGRQ